jgi:hypothetical protein
LSFQSDPKLLGNITKEDLDISYCILDCTIQISAAI